MRLGPAAARSDYIGPASPRLRLPGFAQQVAGRRSPHRSSSFTAGRPWRSEGAAGERTAADAPDLQLQCAICRRQSRPRSLASWQRSEAPCRRGLIMSLRPQGTERASDEERGIGRNAHPCTGPGTISRSRTPQDYGCAARTLPRSRAAYRSIWLRRRPTASNPHLGGGCLQFPRVPRCRASFAGWPDPGSSLA